MMSLRMILAYTLLFMLAVTPVSYASGEVAADSTQTKTITITTSVQKPQKSLDTLMKVLLENYYKADEVSQEELIQSAIKGMTSVLGDPYTTYFTPEQSKRFFQSFQSSGSDANEFVGIGVQVSENEAGEIVILKIFPNAPAKKAGLQVGDVIIMIEDNEVAPRSLEENISEIKGKEGTTVNITIRRGDIEKKLSVKRQKITIEAIPNIEVSVKDNIVWMKIHQFNFQTAQNFSQMLEKYTDEKTQGIIIDLRNNPGGIMSTALDMLGEVLPEGSIGVQIHAPDDKYKKQVSGSHAFTDIPLVVFVNEHSASASEIFAGAIQDNNRGQIIGYTSFGKGVAQEIIQFQDGSSLKVTTQEFRTPLGNTVHGVGIIPEVHFTGEQTDSTFFNAAKRYFYLQQYKNR